jgi:vacuolar protein sorting-associated protein 72
MSSFSNISNICRNPCNIKIWYLLERKSIRRSTAAKSAATLQRLKERTEEGRRRKGRRARAQDEWRPTQEELLEEAKITEQENLKSLGKCIYL